MNAFVPLFIPGTRPITPTNYRDDKDKRSPHQQAVGKLKIYLKMSQTVKR